MDINSANPAAYQLCSQAKGIIHMVNAAMTYFLRLFGIEEEYGLSPFCRDFNTKDELKKEVQCLFQTSKEASNETKYIENSSSESDITSAKCVENYFVMIILKKKCLLKGFREWKTPCRYQINCLVVRS